MRIFNFTLEQTGSNIIVNWCVDTVASCIVRYTTTVVGANITSMSPVEVSTTSRTTTVSGFTQGVEYKFQIIGKSSTTGELFSTPWKYITVTGSQNIIAEGTPVDRTLIPFSSLHGDNISRQFPSWMSLSTTPGTLLYECTNTAGSNKLYFDAIPAVATGMIAFKYDDLSELYKVVESPAAIAIISVSNAYNVLTVDNADVPNVAHITTLSKCWMIDRPTQIYFVVSIDDNEITIDRDPEDCTDVTWIFEQKAVILDRVVEEHNTEVKWGFSTVARNIIDRSMSKLDDLTTYANDTRNMYSPNDLNDALPWLGNICRLPAQDINVEKEIIINRFSTVSEITSSVIPMLKVNTVFDLLYTPAPTYMITNDVVLFHQLSMIEEEISVTPVDGEVLEITLSYPIVLNTTARINGATYSELPIYIYDYVYGWEKLSNGSYYIIPDTENSKTTLVLYNSAVTDPVKVRYCVAKSWEDPYGIRTGQLVNVAVNGVKLASPPSQKTLWNQFDELGLLIGLRRNGFENNQLFKTRLIAAANIDPTPVKRNVLGLLGTILGKIDYTIWDTAQTLTLPASTTNVIVKEMDEVKYLTDQPMLHDQKSTTRRLYLQHIPEGDVTIYVNGNATDKQLTVDTLNTDSTKYLTLSATEWNSTMEITANYAIRMYTLTYDDNGYIDTIVPTAYAEKESFIANVFSTQGIDTVTFQNEAFRKTLVDGYGIANSQYRKMADSLVQESKLITDNAQWGTTSWFYRRNAIDNPQFTMLPQKWD